MPARKTDETNEAAPAKTIKKAKAPARKAAVKKPAAKKTAASGTTVRKTVTKAKTAPRTSTPRASSAASSAAGKNLVIVESPAKAKTLQKYLGSDYRIEASVGHVKDLPTSKMGVDIENGFIPDYVILKGKEKVIERIRKSAAVAKNVYLAPDPDREGEAIAFHLASELSDLGIDDRIFRATFNEITRKAVNEAIANPRSINTSLFEAQQARRILDRLVGYKISPLLWKKVTRGLSAGRVQSVAVRIIVDRDREIKAFVADEYWSLEARVDAASPPPFVMKLSHIDGKKAEMATEDHVRELLLALKAGNVEVVEQEDSENQVGRRDQNRKKVRAKTDSKWTVSRVEKKDVKRRPSPPFITSTLQQEASRKFGYGAKKTMGLAQRLYEGLELGSMGHTALITYMRTDSTRISPDAVQSVREYIGRTYGERSLPAGPNEFRSKKNSQDAHECVRPTDMSLTPDSVSPHLEADQLKLYTVIWNRFVASQMADAIFEQTRIETKPTENLMFTATGLVQKFAGYLAVYEEGRDEQNDDDSEARLPQVAEGDTLDVSELRGIQHFTQPPPRYTEATLVKELEKQGIGRPSTYATIVTVIQDKEYVEKDDSRRFRSTELGNIVTDLLVENFPEVLDIGFTAQMEQRLDAVEDGSQNWQALLTEFYTGFNLRLEAAAEHMKSVKQEEIPTDIQCDKCEQANMVVKFGRNGRFLACPRYPECKNTKEYVTSDSGEISAVAAVESDEECPACGKRMVLKSGRHGRFLACPGYPECKTIIPFKTGVKCPDCSTGDLVERVSKRGKMFFSCNNYPACEHVEWNRPVPKECPQCKNPYLLQKEGKRPSLVCPQCKYTEVLAGDDNVVPAVA